MKSVSMLVVLSIVGLVALPACVGSPEELDAANESVAMESDSQDNAATSDTAGDFADAIVEDDSAVDTSDYALTCTSYWEEYPARCLGKCQAYPNTLRHVGSEPNIQWGECQTAVNNWCLARNYGYATFACWGHL